MDTALKSAGARRPVEVCVELGGPHGRTGARDEDTAIEVAAAVVAAPTLRLAGLAGYEGALAHDASEQGLDTVETYLRRLAGLHQRLPYETGEPLVTAGGSAYFDQVADVLAGAKVVVRAGAYIVHDDGFYQALSPFSHSAGPTQRTTKHGKAHDETQPEPRQAQQDAGKRDLPFDEGLPEPIAVRG